MKRMTCILIAGIPAAGKSTVALQAIVPSALRRFGATAA